MKKMFVIGCIILLLTLGLSGCTSPLRDFRSFSFDCHLSQHEEGEYYPAHPCWGGFLTHTYELPGLITVQRIIGKIKTGPAVVKTFIKVTVQLSTNKMDWTTIGETGVEGNGGYADFIIDVANIRANYLRFIVFDTRRAIDGSMGTVFYEDIPGVT